MYQVSTMSPGRINVSASPEFQSPATTSHLSGNKKKPRDLHFQYFSSQGVGGDMVPTLLDFYSYKSLYVWEDGLFQ